MCARVTHIWGNRRFQPIQSAMDEPQPGWNAFLIASSPAPGMISRYSHCLCLPRFTSAKVLRLTEHRCSETSILNDLNAFWNLSLWSLGIRLSVSGPTTSNIIIFEFFFRAGKCAYALPQTQKLCVRLAPLRAIAGLNRPRVQWAGLHLGSPPFWSRSSYAK